MVDFGREIAGDFSAAARREWLVTNGLGSYAMGTVAGVRTRRYHGLLVAALDPPTDRRLTVAALDTWVEIEGALYPLVTHEWAAGVVLPDGYRHLERFRLEQGLPTFTYALGDVQIIKRVWMRHGHQTTYVTYTYQRGSRPVKLKVTPLCAWRYHHRATHGGYPVSLAYLEDGHGVQVMAKEGALPYRIYVTHGDITLSGEWWWSFYMGQEAYRGLEAQEDLFAASEILAELAPGDTFGLTITLEDEAQPLWNHAHASEQARQDALIDEAGVRHAPGWIQQLTYAADQFVVRRSSEGRSIIAGYPWFTDYSRSTMIALPGLTLLTHRFKDAAAVLRTYAASVSEGMLPNYFPDDSREPQYNAVDAALWYFRALQAYLDIAPTWDTELVEELYPVLVDIVEWHERGTRYGIRVDPMDGLLAAGESGMQLTWMDAKAGGWVVTPRMGKPVEINALWYNALRTMQGLAERLDKPDDVATYSRLADRVYESFNAKFWYEHGSYLFDVIDTPFGKDLSLRPNQLFAVSLPHPMLLLDRARAVVDICARELVTSYGLRTLAPDESDYKGYYRGNEAQRNEAYHQGTVWSWLLGPFVRAHYRVYKDREMARSYLHPLIHHLSDYGLGTIGQLFDGAPPHTPRGAIAQAWSVAEILGTWLSITEDQG